MFGNQARLREQRCVSILSILSAVVLSVCLSAANTVCAEDLPDDADEELLIGDLGISGLEGECRLTMVPGEPPVFEFRSEPYIRAVDRDGPSHGKLRPGDVIVAINGHLITAKAGGELFGNPPAGEHVELTIRRGNRESTVIVVPESISINDARALLSIPEAEVPTPTIALPTPAAEALTGGGIQVEIPAVPTLDLDLRPRSIPPLGRLGFGLTCEDCTIRWDPKSNSYRWEFENPPKVYNVESDSPAYEAGLRRGDKLTHIDGIPLNSEVGGLRFSTLEPGDDVTWTVSRWWKSREVTMTVGSPPMPEAAAPAVPTDLPEPAEPGTEPDRVEYERSHLRYTGSVGSAQIEVRGSDRVTVITSRTTAGDEEKPDRVIIVTGDTIIRIWEEERNAETETRGNQEAPR